MHVGKQRLFNVQRSMFKVNNRLGSKISTSDVYTDHHDQEHVKELYLLTIQDFLKARILLDQKEYGIFCQLLQTMLLDH